MIRINIENYLDELNSIWIAKFRKECKNTTQALDDKNFRRKQNEPQ